jgi:hypothetical protein
MAQAKLRGNRYLKVKKSAKRLLAMPASPGLANPKAHKQFFAVPFLLAGASNDVLMLSHTICKCFHRMFICPYGKRGLFDVGYFPDSNAGNKTRRAGHLLRYLIHPTPKGVQAIQADGSSGEHGEFFVVT